MCIRDRSESLRLPANKRILKKVRHTVHQSHLSRQARHKNLTWSIQVSIDYISQIQGKRVIVVDDVISTGSTLIECAKVLKEQGAREVIGLIIASD
jgi:competence protein ComFC